MICPLVFLKHMVRNQNGIYLNFMRKLLQFDVKKMEIYTFEITIYLPSNGIRL